MLLCMSVQQHPTLNIALLSSPAEAEHLQALVDPTHHSISCFLTLESLAGRLDASPPVHAALLDIETAPLTQDQVLSLASRHPDTVLFCLTRRAVHPELKKSIQDVFFACITKPVQYEELHFFLNCIDI
ncbi:MAG: hypothetical protein ACOCWT_05905 [Desulfohalobiaceae bacterium]